jgi:uncharacterized protein
MKTLILTFLISFTFQFYSTAQDKQADIQSLFELMRSDKMVNDMMENYTNIMKSYALQNLNQDLSEEQTKKFNAFMDFMNKEVVNLTQHLMIEMKDVYDKHFTHEEIIELITFYQSAVGQKLLDKTPEISKEIMDITMNKYMPDFQVRMQEYMEKTMSMESVEEK